MAPACYGAPPTCAPFALSVSSGLSLERQGGVTLPAGRTPPDVIWPINSHRGSVYRVDTLSRQVEAAYYTGPSHGDGCYGGQFAGEHPGGDSPSRAAVDNAGDLYVANRACGGQASVTKIAAEEDRCVDRDRSGTIDTSHAWDQPLPFDSHSSWADECILWHTPLGDTGAQARPLILATMAPPDGEPRDVLWVGLYMEMRLVELDPATGEPTGAVLETPGLTPYNAAVSPDGWVWVVAGNTGIVGRFHIADPLSTYEPTLPDSGRGFARITVDENAVPWASNEALVWMGNRERLDFARLPGFGAVDILADGLGHVWMADGWCRLQRLSTSDAYDVIAIDPGIVQSEAYRDICSLAVDTHRQLWVFAGWTDQTAVVNIDDLTVEPVLDDCGGRLCMVHPYIRGDITGFTRTFNRRDRGTWTGRFTRCAGEASAEIVLEAELPALSAFEVKARSASDESLLADEAWTDLSPDDSEPSRFSLGPSLQERIVDVRVDLVSTRLDAQPVLRKVELLEP